MTSRFLNYIQEFMGELNRIRHTGLRSWFIVIADTLDNKNTHSYGIIWHGKFTHIAKQGEISDYMTIFVFLHKILHKHKINICLKCMPRLFTKNNSTFLKYK